MKEDLQLTEDSLRQALSRLGAGNEASKRHDVVERPDNLSTLTRLNETGRANASFNRKRRLSNDHQVIIEHASHGRKSQNRIFSQSSRVESDNSKDIHHEVSSLRRELRDEKRRSHDVINECETLKSRIKVLETRLAHYSIQMDEQKKLSDTQHKEVLRLNVELQNVNEHKNVVSKKNSRSKKDLPQPLTEAVEDNKEQPVQWWKD